MKTQIILVLLAASIFQVAYSTTCGSATCSGSTPQCDGLGTDSASTCVAATDPCATAYTRADTSAAIAAANLCDTCATNYVKDATDAAATKCISTTGGVCLTGYSDVDGVA